MKLLACNLGLMTMAAILAVQVQSTLAQNPAQNDNSTTRVKRNVATFISSDTDVWFGVMKDLLWNGIKLHSARSPGGCLDAAFSGNMDQHLWGGRRGNCGKDLWSWYPFTVAYLANCNNEPWQTWRLQSGRLYANLGNKAWWANRCVDAFDPRGREDTMACAFHCWGGENQEMKIVLAGRRVVDGDHEVAFFIKPHNVDHRCLTYMGDNNPVRFRTCDTNNEDQMWFMR